MLAPFPACSLNHNSAPGGIPFPDSTRPDSALIRAMELTASLPPEDLADLDRVCRGQGVNRLDAVQAAVRWYIDREGDLPAIDDPAAEEIEA